MRPSARNGASGIFQNREGVSEERPRAGKPLQNGFYPGIGISPDNLYSPAERAGADVSAACPADPSHGTHRPECGPGQRTDCTPVLCVIAMERSARNRDGMRVSGSDTLPPHPITAPAPRHPAPRHPAGGSDAAAIVAAAAARAGGRRTDCENARPESSHAGRGKRPASGRSASGALPAAERHRTEKRSDSERVHAVLQPAFGYRVTRAQIRRSGPIRCPGPIVRRYGIPALSDVPALSSADTAGGREKPAAERVPPCPAPTPESGKNRRGSGPKPLPRRHCSGQAIRPMRSACRLRP